MRLSSYLSNEQVYPKVAVLISDRLTKLQAEVPKQLVLGLKAISKSEFLYIMYMWHNASKPRCSRSQICNEKCCSVDLFFIQHC